MANNIANGVALDANTGQARMALLTHVVTAGKQFLYDRGQSG